MYSGAVITPCGDYRYALWRLWNPDRPPVLFVALNPSTADAAIDDPTVRRCRGYAASWGYGGVIIANLFAYRAIQPAALKEAADPIGPDNDRWIKLLAGVAGLIVAAWGNHGAYQSRDVQVLNLLPGCVHRLGLNRTGHPRHPLYMPASTTPQAHVQAVPEAQPL